MDGEMDRVIVDRRYEFQVEGEPVRLLDGDSHWEADDGVVAEGHGFLPLLPRREWKHDAEMPAEARPDASPEILQLPLDMLETLLDVLALGRFRRSLCR